MSLSSSQGTDERIEKVARGASAVTVAVFISRILGLVREQVLAYFFGAGKSMDAFVVAYRIPNLLRDLFAEGASQAAFVKVLSATQNREGKEQALAVAKVLLANFIIITASTVFLLMILAPAIVSILAPAFKEDPTKFALTVSLTYVTMPFLFFISLSALLAGLLNNLGQFFFPALSSGLFNLASIFIGVIGYFVLSDLGIEPIFAMALGITLGGFLQALFLYLFLRRENFQFKFRPDLRHQAFREVLRLIAPTILGLSVMQINVFVNTFFATSCGEGAVSWYSYAFRVMYVPLGLFGIGITQALLPELTRILSQVSKKGSSLQQRSQVKAQARELFSRSLVLALSLAVPSAAGLYLLSEEVIVLLFERGKFTILDTEMTGGLLAILALALPFYSLSKAMIPLFYSLGKTYVPAMGSLIALLANLSVILLTIEELGVKAVALGTTASLLFQCLFLGAKSILLLGGLYFEVLKRALVAIFLATALMSVFVVEAKAMLASSLKLAVAIPGGALIYYLVVKSLGPRECYMLLERLFLPFVGLVRKGR